MILAVAALSTPIVGTVEGDPLTLHRVEMDGLPIATWETAEHCQAKCGAPVKLVTFLNEGQVPLPWKLIRTRGTPYKRCQVCNGRRT